jgi:hypothetical protein
MALWGTGKYDLEVRTLAKALREQRKLEAVLRAQNPLDSQRVYYPERGMTGSWNMPLASDAVYTPPDQYLTDAFSDGIIRTALVPPTAEAPEPELVDRFAGLDFSPAPESKPVSAPVLPPLDIEV